MAETRLAVTGIVVVVATVPVLAQALHTGRLHLRGRHGRIERRRQPFQFWWSFAVGAMFTLLGAVLIVYGLFKR
jgi:hypothetical protein